MYVILGTVCNFGVFFSIKFKKMDVSIQGTQALLSWVLQMQVISISTHCKRI